MGGYRPLPAGGARTTGIRTGTKQWQRVVGQLDAVGQRRWKEHEALLRPRTILHFGGDADRPHVDRLAVVGPNKRCVVGWIAGIGELDNESELDWASCKPCPQFLDKKVRPHGFGLRIGEIATALDGNELVATSAFAPPAFTKTKALFEKYAWVAKLGGTAAVSCTNFAARGCAAKNASIGHG